MWYLQEFKGKPCNFLWFNWAIYIWDIYILIRSSVPQQSHWLTLSLDDILWTHYEWMQMTGMGPAHEHSLVSISQWYCIWVTAGSFCLSNLLLQLCWNRQHASLISHAVSMGKCSLGVLDQRCHPLFTILICHPEAKSTDILSEKWNKKPLPSVRNCHHDNSLCFWCELAFRFALLELNLNWLNAIASSSGLPPWFA